jgi:hypothetical protein
MTEQGRWRGAAAAGGLTTSTSTRPPQSTITTSSVPSVEQDGTTTVVLTGGQTPLKGVWGRNTGAAGLVPSRGISLASLLGRGLGSGPILRTPLCRSRAARRSAVNADDPRDRLWHVRGDVLPEQNNYAGIRATGGGEPGASFPTAGACVIAHVAHMVAYVYASNPVSWANATTDPRFDLVNPRGAVSVLADLNGRWAVPGTM